ncbi:MAG: hypothetical protein IPG88_13115 [Gemmatimonadetes bacterium]|nr:hypothetical protein [Gemmatimonadota bacterium]
MTMQYRDLAIPGERESRFTGVCDLSVAHGLVSLQPLDLRLHYILPHYHYLGITSTSPSSAASATASRCFA